MTTPSPGSSIRTRTSTSRGGGFPGIHTAARAAPRVASATSAPADSAASAEIAPNFGLAGLLGDGKLAMANVDSVPAGKYGKGHGWLRRKLRRSDRRECDAIVGALSIRRAGCYRDDFAGGNGPENYFSRKTDL